MIEIETTFDALRRFDRVRVGDVDWNVDRVTSTHGMIAVNLSAVHNPARTLRLSRPGACPIRWVFPTYDPRRDATPWAPREQMEIVRYALAAHRENRDLYASVISGRF